MTRAASALVDLARKSLLFRVLVGISCVSILALARATPAMAQLTFPGASPLSAGNLILVEQPTLAEGSGGYQGATAQSILLYGASPNLALITESDLLVSNMANAVSGGKTVRLAATGIGDTIQEARYTVYQLDGIASTFRIAPLIGLTVPTGMDNVNPQLPRSLQPGTGDFGGRVAMTSSWQTLNWNAEAEVGYNANSSGVELGFSPHTLGSSYQFGNQVAANVAFHYVVWPPHLSGDVPAELLAGVESNYFVTQYSHVHGQFVPGTGGQLWLIDPNLDYSTRNYGFAITALLPVLQTVNGAASRYDFGIELHFRWSLFTDHHW